MAKVSIIIPVYNVEKYIRECLDSVQKQTLKELEIICVDDGSTDASGNILDEYAEKDERFQVIHKKNEGYGKAINVGMDMVTSPYVGIVESDDWISYNMYQELYRWIEEIKADVIKANFYVFYEGLEGTYIEEEKSLVKGIYTFLYNQVFSLKQYPEAMLLEKYTWSGIYRTEFLREERIRHNETPGAAYQDNGFWFQTMVKAKKIYCIDQPFYHYRIDNMNSSIHNKEKVFDVCNEFDFIRRFLDEIGEEGRPYYKWSVYFKIIDCVINIGRVSKEYRTMLAERVREEFIKGVQAGEVDAKLYQNNWREQIFEVIVNPEAYANKITEKERKLRNEIEEFQQIILYGAGKIGKRVLGHLTDGRVRTRVKCFAVSDIKQNEEKVEHIPVKDIRELQKYKENVLVILAVGENYMSEINKMMEELGFLHYISWKVLFE